MQLFDDFSNKGVLNLKVLFVVVANLSCRLRQSAWELPGEKAQSGF